MLLVFLFLTQITEQYLDVVTAEEQEVRGEEGGGAGFPIISDSGESPRQWGRHSLWLVLESAGGLTQADRDVAILLKYINKYCNLIFIIIYVVIEHRHLLGWNL